MKFLQRAALTAAAIWLGSASARADSLGMGDPAPKLASMKFVKGEPVHEFAKGKTYVVEFWATWCGPCIASIPHLSEMQQQHKDVTFIGVSVWESDQSLVKPFVEKMGAKMDYRVAMDLVPEAPKEKDDGDKEKKPVRKQRQKGEMAANWLEAAHADGIPTAFVVNGEGRIAWVGHPMEMEEPLDKIVAGKWDIAAEKERAAIFKKLIADLSKAMRNKDKSALELIDKAIAMDAKMESRLGMTKFNLLAESTESSDIAKAVEYGDRLLDKVYNSKQAVAALNQLAWTIVDPDSPKKFDKKVKEFALRAAEKGDTLAEGKDPAIADTLAKAYFDCGNAAKALATQERAVKLAKGTEFEKDKSLVERLEAYKKAVADKVKAN